MIVLGLLLLGIAAATLKAKKLPGIMTMPDRHWFWGDLWAIRRNFDRGNDFLLECQKIAKDKCYQMGLPFTGRVYVNLPPSEEAVRWVLKDNFEGYVKDYDVEKFREITGHGIFGVDGNPWRSQRKVASKLFSLRQLRDHMCSVFLSHADEMVSECDGDISRARHTDLQQLFFKYTSSSFLEIGFGRRMPAAEAAKFAKCFDSLQTDSFLRVARPFWYLEKILGLTTAERRIKKSNKVLKKIAKKYSVLQDSDGLNLLSLYLQDAKKRGVELSEDFLRDVVMNFMLAGRDTTACTLTWTVYRLCRHPKIRQKCLEEINQAVKNNDGVLDYSVAKNCVYLERVIYEVLRLHPPVPSDSKRAVKDDVLPDGTRIPRGTTVTYRPYVFGRSPLLWEEPLLFKPSRWKNADISQYKFVTFNAGPRLCLGKDLAILEAKLFLCVFLPRYTVLPMFGTPVWRPGLLLAMKDGLNGILRHRSPQSKL